MVRVDDISTAPRAAWLLVGALALGSGCGDDGGGTGSGDTGSGDSTSTGGADGTTAAQLPEGCDFWVEPGDDDQTAVQEAFIDVQTGQTVCLGPGTFSFTRQLSLDADGVTVRGDGRETTVLDFSGQISGGNGMLITGNDVTVESLRVLDTPGDGIRADNVDNVAFVGMDVVWQAQQSLDAGAYGLYPVQSNGVTIRDCLVEGARDAGIYVGQSTRIVVEDSEARGNVAGIEIENSTDAIVRRNHSHDNTAGILVFNLPGLDIGDGKRANVYDNVVENNNVPNFGEPGTVVALVPPGIGVLVLAADHNEIWRNELRGNDSAAVVLLAYVDDLFAPPDDPDFDISAEGNWVHDNTLEGNGTDPDELILAVTNLANPSPDILFDGCFDAAKDNGDGSLSNCVSGMDDATFMAIDLCNQGMPETTADNYTCQQPALPTEL
ncbi:MAG: right-handed parallel beta-helix repeat-containing protein [Myxococcales bacterium]|nr:right-handed parallel beta-helix repeat-containing protein [Myxococcales bacterium]